MPIKSLYCRMRVHYKVPGGVHQASRFPSVSRCRPRLSPAPLDIRQFALTLKNVHEATIITPDSAESVSTDLHRLANSLDESPETYLPMLFSLEILDWLPRIVADSSCPNSVIKAALRLFTNVLFLSNAQPDYIPSLLVDFFPGFQSQDPEFVSLLAVFFSNCLSDNPEWAAGFIEAGFFHSFLSLIEESDPEGSNNLGQLLVLFSSPVFPLHPDDRVLIFAGFAHLIGAGAFRPFLECLVAFLVPANELLFNRVYATELLDFVTPVFQLLERNEHVGRALLATEKILLHAPDNFGLSRVPVDHLIEIASDSDRPERAQTACKILIRYVELGGQDSVSELSSSLFFVNFERWSADCSFEVKLGLVKLVMLSCLHATQLQWTALQEMGLMETVLETIDGSDVEYIVLLLGMLMRARKYDGLERFLPHFDELVRIFEAMADEEVALRDQFDWLLGKLARIRKSLEQESEPCGWP
jgi:hypothetical protein